MLKPFETPIWNGKQSSLMGLVITGSFKKRAPGPVTRATFSFNLSRNMTLQVGTLCIAYYHVSDQLVSHQNTVLHVCKILHVQLINRV